MSELPGFQAVLFFYACPTRVGFFVYAERDAAVIAAKNTKIHDWWKRSSHDGLSQRPSL